MCNVRLQAPTLARKFDIYRWFPCGADGRVDVQSRDYQYFWGMGLRLCERTRTWGSAINKWNFFNQKALDARLFKENQDLLSYVFRVACTQTFPSRLEFVSREGASVHRLCSKHFFPLFFLLPLIVPWSKGTKSSLVYLLRGVISIISELLPRYSF